MLPTSLTGEMPDDKLGILDVLVFLADGTRIDLEMQIAYFAHWEKRILFYLGRMYTGQLQKGDPYEKLQKCIHVSILDFIHFPEDNECYRTIHLRDDHFGKVYTDLFEIQILELKKLSGTINNTDGIISWMKFFSGKSREEFEHMAKTNEYVNEAYQTLLNLSADDQKRLEYEAREKAIRDYNSQMKSSRDQGIDLGIVQGKLEAYMELIQDGLITVEEAAKRLQMPEEKLEKKLKEIKDK